MTSMTDEQLWPLIGTVLEVPLRTLSGVPELEVIQTYQPTQQGVPSPPFVSIHRIGAPRYGFTQKRSVYNVNTGVFDAVDVQLYEGVYQAQVLATDNPADTNDLSAYDIAVLASGVMQLDSTLTTLRASGVGIYRITDIRTPYFVDDRQRNEQTPSFDFTLSYAHVLNSTVPLVAASELDINRV